MCYNASLPWVLSVHAEEAAFLWGQRYQALGEPHYTLQDLVDLDERIEAHVDGVRVAGPAGWAQVLEELTWHEPGEVFLASVLAFESGVTDRVERILDVGLGDPELARGVKSALGWLPWKTTSEHATRLTERSDSLGRSVGLRAFGLQRLDPGTLLAPALESPDPIVRVAALRTAGEVGRRDLVGPVLERSTSKDQAEMFWAGWAGVLLGDKEAARALFAVASRGDHPYRSRAADLLARSMPLERTLHWFRLLTETDGDRPLACVVARASGSPAVIPWLLEAMSEPELARAAGEAFSSITGADLAYLDLEAETPEGFEAGPTEDPADAAVGLDRDEDLPWPDGDRVAEWWAELRGRLNPESRYLTGHPLDPWACARVLVDGKQRDRAAAALELVLAAPGRPLMEIRARGRDQRRALAARP